MPSIPFNINLSIEIPKSELDKLEKIVIESVIKDLAKRVRSKKEAVLAKIGQVLVKHFFTNPVIVSLLSDDPHGLRAEMGIPRDKSDIIIQEILARLLKSIDIDIKETVIGNRGNIKALLYSNIRADDFLSVPGASYTSNKYNIPWLNWILHHAGQFVLSTNHNITTRDFNPVDSRSKLAIMIQSNTAWKVPSWVAFPGNKNFIEKIMEDVEVEAKKLIEESF